MISTGVGFNLKSIAVPIITVSDYG